VFFAGLLLLFPAQLLVAKVIGEPYPALFMPAFAGTPVVDSILTRTEPRVTIEFADGTSTLVPYTALLPRSTQNSAITFRNVYASASRVDDASTTEWLAATLPTTVEGSPATTVRIEWFRVEYRLPDLEVIGETPMSDYWIRLD
jgi:hypothetical protein